MTHFRRRFYRFNLFSSHPKNTGNSQYWLGAWHSSLRTGRTDRNSCHG